MYNGRRNSKEIIMSEVKKPGYLEDSDNNPSSMRLMSAVSLLAAIVFAYIAITSLDTNADSINIVFGFLIAAFAPKAVQKFAEKK